jgi:DNA-binding NtrC family response regulator
MNAKARIEILLADDDFDFLEILSSYIERIMGSKPHLARNGLDALVHLQCQSTQLLITDTNMPELNGVDLMTRALDHSPNLKVIVLFSGLNGSKIDAKEVKRLGAHAVMMKSEIHNRLFPILREYAFAQTIYRSLEMIDRPWSRSHQHWHHETPFY